MGFSDILATLHTAYNRAMRMSANEFRQSRRKAVTLMGMSGVGKTVLANRLPETRWFIYSGDYRSRHSIPS